ncbi:MAG: PhoX family protein [Gammaproteobacteria bacterium]|nr:PhoX family protein [Gammaproteobacteria bacterium]
MNKNHLLASAITAALTISGTVQADDDKKNNSFSFKPLEESANAANWDPTAPWKLPKGFKQTVVSDEADLNIYDGGRDDWHDMNVVNETGPMAGRFMYRTHELRFPANQPEGGTVTVVDLETGATSILAQDPSYNALDGIRWSPWGTVVFAEETTGGRFFEIELDADLTTAAVIHDRPAVGRLAHEGIDFDADGNVYVVDEHRGRTSGCDLGIPCGGGIYKFVPHNYGDLSSGDLYVLGIKTPLNNEHRADNTGQGEWLGPIDATDARRAGTLAGGASYQRPEDLEIIDGNLYVAITEGPRDEYGKEYYEGRVIAVDLQSMQVTNFVKAGVNAPVEIGKPGQEGHQTGFDSVDNLAEAPNGDLIMIEDNKPSDIWFASTKTNEYGASKDVDLFASLTDPGAEGTGIYFSPTDDKTLYVNVQHSAADDGDATWAITRKGKGHWKDND